MASLPMAPALTQRFVRSIKEECLSRMIFFGPASLQHAVRQFMAHRSACGPTSQVAASLMLWRIATAPRPWARRLPLGQRRVCTR
jgi:hypothetical protein